MPNSRQHFVPQVYLKSWIGANSTNDAANKLATQLYLFNKDCSFIGPRSTDTVCYGKHTYTVDWEHSFIAEKCPEIGKDFAERISEILIERNVDAFFNGKKLITIEDYASVLRLLDKWEFYQKDGTLATNKRIKNQINSIHSYVIEKSFCGFVETHFESLIGNFLNEVENAQCNIYSKCRVIQEETAKAAFEILILMACRNPLFDCFGLYPSIVNMYFDPIIDLNADDSEFLKHAAQTMKRGVWLTEIYKILYNEKNNIADVVWKQFKKMCRFLLFHVEDGADYGFITSDNPAVYYINNIEIENHNGIYFPLSPDYLLMAARSSDGAINEIDYRTASIQDVRLLNRIIRSAADEQIISRQKNICYIL